MYFEQSNFHTAVPWFKMGETFKNENGSDEITESVAENILQRISHGEQNAVQDCLNQYGGLVWSLARRMLPGNIDAEDAVQEIFVEIWKNADRFDASKASETTFIAMIARRRLIDRIRKSSRQPFSDSIDEMVVEPAGADGKEIYASIEAERAARAMKLLKPEQQNVLRLSIMEGYSHSEIAELMKIPLGTVKTHARRGLMEVRNALDAESGKFGKEVSA